MGQFTLIDSYLETLRKTVAWRPDSDDVVAELTDHLLVSVEREIAVGVDPIDAQRASLDRFGESRLVSRAFASTYLGGVAVPTQLTKRSGLIGMIGAGAMLAFFFLLLVQNVPLLERDGLATQDIVPLGVWRVVYAVAFGGAAVLIYGIKQRHGGVLGKQAWVGFGLAMAGAVFAVLDAWILVSPVALFTGLGALIIGLSMLREDLSPRFATTLFTVGLLLSLGIWAGIEIAGIGTTDVHGDAILPRVVAFATMGVVFVPGYFLLGRWLHGESAVDEVDSPLIAS